MTTFPLTPEPVPAWTRILEDHTIEGHGIVLWNPIARTDHSRLGLYNDDRFPGRCILALNGEFTNICDVPCGTLTGFMRDAQFAMTAIQLVTQAARVNFSILGNREPFVHAHLIPRFPDDEARPDCSPWNDPRKRHDLSRSQTDQLITEIWERLLTVDTRHISPRSLPEKEVYSLPGLDLQSLGLIGSSSYGQGQGQPSTEEGSVR